jgi:hypothetical protein
MINENNDDDKINKIRGNELIVINTFKNNLEQEKERNYLKGIFKKN